MFDFAARLRLLSRRNPTSEVAEAPEGKNTLRLLLVTRDDDLSCSVQNAAARCGWQMRLARSVEQSIPVLDEFRAPLVIYDWNPEEGDWRFAVDCLTARPDRPSVLLASPVVDQYLWAELVRHGGFEVIPRSANVEQLIRSVRFAQRSSDVKRGGRSFSR
jgi:DNA-binding NtrC family response regulator